MSEKIKRDPTVIGNIKFTDRLDPKGSSYCNWDQKGHQKDSHTRFWNNGSCSKADEMLEWKVSGKFDKAFLTKFAEAGGKIEGDTLKINASEFNKVVGLLEKPVTDDHLTVVGSHRRPDGINPVADWTKHCYLDGSNGRCVGSELDDSIILKLEGGQLDKELLKKIADAGGVIEEGNIKVDKVKLDHVARKVEKK